MYKGGQKIVIVMLQNQDEGQAISAFRQNSPPEFQEGIIDNTVCYSLADFPREREDGKNTS